jgi:sugar phosphate isomerase/epimerase
MSPIAREFPELKYTVCCWSTPKNGWREDIAQSAAIGASAVGLWEAKFADGEDNAILDALGEHGIAAGIVVPRNWTILPTPLDPKWEGDWKHKTDAICRSIERFAKFKPAGIMVGPGVSGDPAKRLGPVEHVVDGLALAAKTAAEHGLRIAFEPLSLRRGAAVATIPETIAVMDAVGRDNVGILMDVWHNWDQQDLQAHMRSHVKRFLGIQVNDYRNPTRSWCDRMFPGEGVDACMPIVAALLDAGYTGWWDFEVFSDDGRWGNAWPESLWALPHDVFLERGRDKFLDCYRRAKAAVASGRVPPMPAPLPLRGNA